MTHGTDVVCEPPAQRGYPPEPTPTCRAQDALVRHHQPQQQQQQHQPRQHNTQQQHAQTVHGSTTKSLRQNPADERGNIGTMVAHPTVDEVARQHQAAGRDGQTSLSSTPAATPATTHDALVRHHQLQQQQQQQHQPRQHNTQQQQQAAARNVPFRSVWTWGGRGDKGSVTSVVGPKTLPRVAT